ERKWILTSSFPSKAQRRADAEQRLLHRRLRRGLAVDALELVIPRHAQTPVGTTEREREPQIDRERRRAATRELGAGAIVGAPGEVGAGAEVHGPTTADAHRAEPLRGELGIHLAAA